jgi:hypothetical protein
MIDEIYTCIIARSYRSPHLAIYRVLKSLGDTCLDVSRYLQADATNDIVVSPLLACLITKSISDAFGKCI